MAEGPSSIDGRDPTSAGGRRGLMSPGEALQPDPVPPPPPGPRKPRPIVATVSGVLSFIGIAAVALVIVASLAAQRLDAPGPLPADKVVVIAPGTDTTDIVAQLEGEGVIDSGLLMSGLLRVQGEWSRLKAGEYLFKQNVSLRDVVDELVSGRQILHAITIPEGLTSEQICDRLRAEDVLTGDIKALPKEGTLMPNTYKVARGTSRDQVLRLMAQEDRKIVAEAWAHRAPDTPIRSPYDMVILASIVEKETGKADERPRVAGVFVNRLVKNIPLQSDPTIVYGLVGGKATLGRGILKSEIEQKTPYNTYTITGLPPGPICNPGRAAMEAVANPSRTREIYFVADGTGGHAFAETLDQHRQNVQRWRALEKDAKDKASPDPGTAVGVPPPVSGQPAPPSRQRGDAAPSVPVYGALPGRSEPPAAALLLGVTQPPIELSLGDAANRFASPTPDQTASLDPDGPGDGATDPASFFGVGPADGRVAVASSGPGLSFPVSAAQRADEKARAARYGAPPGSDAPLPSGVVASAEPGAPPTPGRLPSGHTAITDASEGTTLDPLRDRTYDLMTAKTVPAALSTPFRPSPIPGQRAAAEVPRAPARADPRRAKPARPAAAAPADAAPAAATP